MATEDASKARNEVLYRAARVENANGLSLKKPPYYAGEKGVQGQSQACGLELIMQQGAKGLPGVTLLWRAIENAGQLRLLTSAP